MIEHPEFRCRRPTQTFGVDRAHDTLGLWTGLGLFCLDADRAITRDEVYEDERGFARGNLTARPEACRGILRVQLGLGACARLQSPVLPAASRARAVRPPCISTDTEFVAFRIVHDDEVDTVVRIVMSGPALHAGAQVTPP